MKLPEETKPLLLGAGVGAVVVAIVGFTWGGWVTAAKAETMATTRMNDAVVATLAPMCVLRFEGAADVGANRDALRAAASWSQGEFVEKGGWAAVEKGASPERVTAVARACATLLVPG